jgi:hypothetical protein
VLNVSKAHKSLWTHPMILLRDVGQVEAPLGLLRESVNLGTR